MEETRNEVIVHKRRSKKGDSTREYGVCDEVVMRTSRGLSERPRSGEPTNYYRSMEALYIWSRPESGKLQRFPYFHTSMRASFLEFDPECSTWNAMGMCPVPCSRSNAWGVSEALNE
jgi:hypothetical protein